MATESIVQALAGLFKKPLNKLPHEKRIIAEAYIKQWPKLSPAERHARAEEVDRQRATKLRIKLVRVRRKHGEAKKDPKQAAGEIVGWNDATLDAATWWRITSIKPGEAARLLCQSNPNNLKYDPLNTTTTETKPVDFKNLLREFEDVAEADAQARTLRQWRDIAKERGLKYHSWIDEYERAMQSVQKDTDDRHNAGRYALWEVAAMLEKHAGKRAGDIVKKLMQAVRDDILPVYEPGKQTRYQYQTERGWDKEAYVNDVNTWLAVHPELATFRLDDVAPAAPEQSKVETGKTRAANKPKSKKPASGFFSLQGKAGAMARLEPMRKLREWALERYKQEQWRSANAAAVALKDEVIAHGRTIGAHLTDGNAQRTIAEWFRKSV